jgi:hypothetical protein
MFRSKTLILVLLFSLAILAGCRSKGSSIAISGSGTLVSIDKELSDFSRLEFSHSFRLNAVRGEVFSVVIRVDDNIAEHLDVSKKGSRLKVGLNPSKSYNIKNATMQAWVTLPELTGVHLSGSSYATLSGFESSADLSVELSGSSSVEGEIICRDARFDLSGSSHVVLVGSSRNLTVDASGSSIVDLAEFLATDADVDISGSSTVTVNASGKIDAEASGVSRIFYLGDPTLPRIKTSGSSSIARQ